MGNLFILEINLKELCLTSVEVSNRASKKVLKAASKAASSEAPSKTLPGCNNT